MPGSNVEKEGKEAVHLIRKPQTVTRMEQERIVEGNFLTQFLFSGIASLDGQRSSLIMPYKVRDSAPEESRTTFVSSHYFSRSTEMSSLRASVRASLIRAKPYLDLTRMRMLFTFR